MEPELAAGSAPNTLEFLREFYTNAYDRIKPNIKDGAYVVFHDGFQLKAWKDFLTQEKYVGNVVLDTHQYLMMAEAFGCEQSMEGYLKYIEDTFAKDFAEVQEYVPVICGEWCLFNSLAVGMDTKGGQTSLNGMDFGESVILTPEQKAEIPGRRQGPAGGLEPWKRLLLLDLQDVAGYRGRAELERLGLLGSEQER